MLKLQCINLFKKVVKIMDNNYNVFRRAAVGGFNRQDVITYIEKMRNEFFDYKKEVEQTVNQLNEKIRELERFCEEKPEAVEEPAIEAEAAEKEETDAVSEINEATLKLRMVADDLCQSLCFFMEKVSENAISVVIADADNDEDTADDETESAQMQTDDVKDEIDADDSAEETDSGIELQTEETEEIIPDAVESILSFADSFSFDVKAEEKKAEKVKEEAKGDILDILGTAGFLV